MAPEATAPIIDLGTDFAPVPAGDGRLRLHGLRTAAIIATIVLALFGPAAAGILPANPLTPVASVGASIGGIAMVSGDRLLVADGRRGGRLVAYQLSTGARLWTARLSMDLATAQMLRIGNTVLVGHYVDAGSGDNLDGIDLATGRLLWHSRATIFHAGAQLVVFDPPASASGDAAAVTESGLDPRTGRVLWRRSGPADCRIDVGAVLADVCPETSVLRTFDLGNGAPLATRKLDIVPQPGRNPSVFRLDQADGVVAVQYPGPGGPILQGVDAATGTLLWSRPVTANTSVAPCGALFCISGSQAMAIDPRTAADRPFPDVGALGSVAVPVPPDVQPGPIRPGSGFAMVPAGMQRDAAGDYSGATDLADIGEDQAVRVPSSAPVDTFLAAVDAATLHLTVLTRLRGVGVLSCFRVSNYLACASSDVRLQLWRISSGTG